MPGLKMGLKNDVFWSEIGSGFGELGDTCPPLKQKRAESLC